MRQVFACRIFLLLYPIGGGYFKRYYRFPDRSWLRSPLPGLYPGVHGRRCSGTVRHLCEMNSYPFYNQDRAVIIGRRFLGKSVHLPADGVNYLFRVPVPHL